MQSTMARVPRRSVALTLAAGVLVSSLTGCADRQEAAGDDAASPALTVELVSGRREIWPETLVAAGEIQAWEEVSVGTELNGVRLDELLVNVGDRVVRGQTLARFDTDALEVELRELDAEVGEARAVFEQARFDAERAAGLRVSGALSERDLVQARLNADAAEARLFSATARRDAQGLRISYAEVAAPVDGVVSSRTARVGVVASSGTELLRIMRDNRLEWRAEVPVEALARLTPDMPVTVFRPDEATVEGRLRRLAPAAERGTRNALAYVELETSAGLIAGTYVSGEFVLGRRPALTLPDSALVLRDGNHYVMTVDDANQVHEVKVSTGRRLGDFIEVISDIDPSSRVIRTGAGLVNAGDTVRVADGVYTPPLKAGHR